MLTQNRNNVMVRRIISLLCFFLLVLPASGSYAGLYNCSQNQLVDNDLMEIDAAISGGVFTVQVGARKPFTSLSIGTKSQVDFFIDYDQNAGTGDARPGAIRGADIRISCEVTLVPLCLLYTLPTTFDGPEQKSSVIPAATLLAQDYILQVSIPSLTFKAFDVFAFAHGRVPVFGGKTGNGDRCPETGIFDTATGTAKVRTPAAAVDAVIDDPSGWPLYGWGFQTFGDQFRIFVDYQTPIDVTSLNFQGRLELDTDRALPTGLVQTPFIIDSPFNEIPSWGWDVAIKINGGGQTGDDPTPISLDFGKQSEFIQAPKAAFPFFPFGEGYNDGRWYVNGDQLVLEGSLSQLDTRQWRYLGNGSTAVSRVPTDGRMIGRLFTNLNDGTITDMIPKNDKAFDTGAKTELPAIQWVTDKMVSGMAPANDVERQWDLTQVDGQLVGKNLVVRGTLTRLDPSWRDTGLGVFLDTDLNTSTGTQISSFYGGQTIGADYVMWIAPRVIPVFLGYTTIFVKPDHSSEGDDNWVNIKFSDPNLANSPAHVIVTIPLSAIGNPKNAVRLYLGTVTESIQDIAPIQPLSLVEGAQKFLLSVNRLGTGICTITSTPPGINCGTDCGESYATGTSVTLTATPDSGSTFGGWSGACSGTGSCVVPMTADKSVTATCNPQISLGEAVDNTVLVWDSSGNTPWSGQTTVSFSGGDAARSGQIADYQTSNLDTVVTGPGTLSFYWKVSSEPKYDKLIFLLDQAEQFNINGEVDWQQKTVNIPSGQHTLKWSYTKDVSKGLGSDAGFVDLVIFTPSTTNYALTVSKAGSGSGKVNSSPVGIDCGTDCSESYAAGTSVTLTATPDNRSTFSGWSGACSGTGNCVVPMTSAKSVIATFSAKKADFLVTGITLNPISPTVNSAFSAKVKIKNQGNATGNGRQLGVWKNRATITTCKATANKYVWVGNLAAGESKTVTVTGIVVGNKGSKTLRAFVDSNCGTSESNEDNNQAIKTYTVK